MWLRVRFQLSQLRPTKHAEVSWYWTFRLEAFSGYWTFRTFRVKEIITAVADKLRNLWMMNIVCLFQIRLLLCSHIVNNFVRFCNLWILYCFRFVYLSLHTVNSFSILDWFGVGVLGGQQLCATCHALLSHDSWEHGQQKAITCRIKFGWNRLVPVYFGS